MENKIAQQQQRDRLTRWVYWVSKRIVAVLLDLFLVCSWIISMNYNRTACSHLDRVQTAPFTNLALQTCSNCNSSVSMTSTDFYEFGLFLFFFLTQCSSWWLSTTPAQDLLTSVFNKFLKNFVKFCSCVRAELCLQLIVSAAFDLVPVHLNYSSDYVFESDCVLCFDHFLSHTQALSCIAWILIKNMPPPESVRLQYDALYNAGNINKQKSLETRNNYSHL